MINPLILTDVLGLLDDIATRPCTMGFEDIGDLCEAREMLAGALGATYDEATSRHVIPLRHFHETEQPATE